MFLSFNVGCSLRSQNKVNVMAPDICTAAVKKALHEIVLSFLSGASKVTRKPNTGIRIKNLSEAVTFAAFWTIYIQEGFRGVIQ